MLQPFTFSVPSTGLSLEMPSRIEPTGLLRSKPATSLWPFTLDQIVHASNLSKVGLFVLGFDNIKLVPNFRPSQSILSVRSFRAWQEPNTHVFSLEPSLSLIICPNPLVSRVRHFKPWAFPFPNVCTLKYITILIHP